FGSARTLPDDPLYAQARNLASTLADEGWMVVTGAGPGIMAAGVEGAGVDRSIGINIRLPFEQDPSPLLAADPKLVEMKYFFTRKLMLMKESAGFAVLPGGFGTQDEAFELLTLLQTGKAAPAPIVLLDVPGGTYWQSWDRFVRDELASRGLIDADDHSLYFITDDVDAASAEIRGFYRNFHSIRYVGRTLVIRMQGAPTPEQLERLNEDFSDIYIDGAIEVTDPLPAEVATGDNLDLARVRLSFDKHHHGRLRQLIDALNDLTQDAG
ncbi:MAG: family Rossman fold protein, partial [Acidimicrobiales bacterium]|nr:family Rossman fold protein [Acidimicrobiales bacterium]